MVDTANKEVAILGRVARWSEHGIEYQAVPDHRRFISEYPEFDAKS